MNDAVKAMQPGTTPVVVNLTRAKQARLTEKDAADLARLPRAERRRRARGGAFIRPSRYKP